MKRWRRWSELEPDPRGLDDRLGGDGRGRHRGGRRSEPLMRAASGVNRPNLLRDQDRSLAVAKMMRRNACSHRRLSRLKAKGAERAAAPVLRSLEEPFTDQRTTGVYENPFCNSACCRFYCAASLHASRTDDTFRPKRHLRGTDEASTAACRFYILGVTEGAGLGAALRWIRAIFVFAKACLQKKWFSS